MNSNGFHARHWLFAWLPLLMGTGCVSMTLESSDLQLPKPQASVAGCRFRVESVDGKIDEAEFSPSDVNAALQLVRPDLYGADDSIPLAVRLGGGTASAAHIRNPLMALLFLSSGEAPGEVKVKIYREDGETGRVGTTPYRMLARTSLFPWALMVSEGPGRIVVYKRPGGTKTEAMNDATKRMVGIALGKAIDSLTEEEIAALSRHVPLTLHDVVRRRRLESLEVPTVHIADGNDGRDSSIVTHGFKITEEPEAPKHPEVLAQDYNAARRIGKVRIDETGFGKDAADDFSARLISRICETKAVVIELGSLPPPGASYRILRERFEEGNVHVILFEQLQ